MMQVLRHVLNAGSHITKGPHIPAAGHLLDIVYLSLPLVRAERLDVFAQLVSHVAGTLDRRSLCVLGLCATDPLLAALRFRAYKERFGLYLVSPDDKAPAMKRVPYVEAGTL